MLEIAFGIVLGFLIIEIGLPLLLSILLTLFLTEKNNARENAQSGKIR